MTNAELIQKIRSEVERLENYYTSVEWYVEALLSFLSTLESEKPVPNDLQEYASRAGFDYVDNIVQEHPGHRFNDHDVEYAYRDGIIAGAKWDREQLLEWAKQKQYESLTIVADNFWQEVIDKIGSM